MRIAVLQHVPFEGPGFAGAWLADREFEIDTIRLYAGDPLPDRVGLHGVLVMGGPMSVNDEADWPWLVGEKTWLRQAIDDGVPTLGVCLGAQLIASAFGSAVRAMGAREIGWFDVFPVDTSVTDGFRFPEVVRALHWHGEQFEIPAGAQRLAENAVCGNQAFQLGRGVLGFQFHLESDVTSVEALLKHCSDELEPGPAVQSESAIREGAGLYGAAANALMAEALSYLFEH